MNADERKYDGPQAELTYGIVGCAIARSTRSGTLVGPGIWRKCRPLWKAIDVLRAGRRGAGARGELHRGCADW